VDDDDVGLLTSSRLRHPAASSHDIGQLNEYLHHLPESAIDEDGEVNAEDAFGSGSIGGLTNISQESLPHIPLRPFRNQVGGHSAIYKFTKRAVCKVRLLNCSMMPVISMLTISFFLRF
jgi:hypothetical protein